MGNYQVSPEFKSLARPSEELTTLSCVSPEDIVERIINTGPLTRDSVVVGVK